MRFPSISVHRVLPLVAVALVTGLLFPGASTASIQEAAVIPPQPSRCDSILFHAAGYFPDGCWHYDGYDVSILHVLRPPDVGPGAVYLMRIFSHHSDSTGCPLVIVPYNVSHMVGVLSPGFYELMVAEVDSQDSTKMFDQRWVSFTVRDSCGPVESCVIPSFAPANDGCNATVGLGRPGFLTVTLRNPMPIAGAEIIVDGFGQLDALDCGQGVLCDWRLSVTNVEPLLRAADMGVEWTFKDGKLHLMLHPLSMLDNTPGLGIIEPGEGPVARIWVQLLSDTLTPTLPIPEYDLQIVLNPVAFADEQGGSVPACPTFMPITGTLCIRNVGKCDINADGRSDVVDIVNMIKCIMCTIPEGCCTPDQVLRADCNGDGVLNVNDVVCCIRYILGSLCSWCETEEGGSQGSASPASIGLSDKVSWESETRFTVPITFSSPVGAGGVEARLSYDPQVLSVERIAVPTGLDGATLYYDASGGELSLMVVAMDNNPLPLGVEGVLAEISFAFVPGAESYGTEIRMGGAASADTDGNRLSLVRTNEQVKIAPQAVPPVRLASRPNPFLSSTDVSLSVVLAQKGSLAVYDVTGRLVKTLYRGYLPEGLHTFKWDGKGDAGLDVRSGVYFVRFEGESNTLTAKVVLLKSR